MFWEGFFCGCGVMLILCVVIFAGTVWLIPSRENKDYKRAVDDRHQEMLAVQEFWKGSLAQKDRELDYLATISRGIDSLSGIYDLLYHSIGKTSSNAS